MFRQRETRGVRQSWEGGVTGDRISKDTYEGAGVRARRVLGSTKKLGNGEVRGAKFVEGEGK